MRKIALSLSIFLVALIAIGISFTSCNKDEFTEEDAINMHQDYYFEKDTFDRDQLIEDLEIEYTVMVIDAGTNNILKSTEEVEGLAGAVVTLTHGDTMLTGITNAAGMVIFADLKLEYVSVNITLANYSEVHYVAQISGNIDGGDTKRSTVVPMIPIAGVQTANITGEVTIESNLLNTVPEAAAGVQVLATVDMGSPAIPDLSGYSNIDPLTMSYGNLNMTATTAADGSYSITVPATADGLNYTLEVLDFERDQSLLMPTVFGRDTTGVVVIPTLFGSAQDPNESGNSDIHEMYPAYIEFDPPVDTRIAAVASAVVDADDGVESINLTNAGDGYNLVDTEFYTIIDNGTEEERGIAHVVLEDNFGRVEYIEVEEAGSNHSGTSTVELSQLIVGEVATVGTNGEIYSVTVLENPTIIDVPIDPDPVDPDYQLPESAGDASDLIYYSEGSGAEMDPVWSNDGAVSGGLFEFSFGGFTPVDSGSGYAVGDLILIPLSPTTPAQANVNIESGSIVSIQVTTVGNGYVDGFVTVLIEGGGGSGATATANVVNGKIDYIEVTDGGTGYTSAPIVRIINEIIPEQAELIYLTSNSKGELDGGMVLQSDAADGTPFTFGTTLGAGYEYPVTISITNTTGGSIGGATAVAELNAAGEIIDLFITDPGSGFNGENTPDDPESPDEVTVTVKGAGNVLNNIHLGTGIRTIED